jgi:hypothetical protein
MTNGLKLRVATTATGAHIMGSSYVRLCPSPEEPWSKHSRERSDYPPDFRYVNSSQEPRNGARSEVRREWEHSMPTVIDLRYSIPFRSFRE